MSVDAVASRFNPLVAGLLRLPVLHWLLSPMLLLLTVTGRRSGRRYSIPVGYRRENGGLTVLVSEARDKQWWRNFQEAAPVQLRLRGRDRSARARLVAPESGEFRDRAERALRLVPGLARVFHVRFDRLSGLGDEEVAHLRSEIAIVRIELDEGGPGSR